MMMMVVIQQFWTSQNYEDDSDDNSNVGDSSSDGTQETFVKASPPLCWGGYPWLMALIEGPCSDDEDDGYTS